MFHPERLHLPGGFLEGPEVDGLYATLLFLNKDLDIAVLVLADPIFVEIEVLEGPEDLEVRLILVLVKGSEALLVLESLLATVALEFQEGQTDQVVAVLGLADAAQVPLPSLPGREALQALETLLLLLLLEQVA